MSPPAPRRRRAPRLLVAAAVLLGALVAHGGSATAEHADTSVEVRGRTVPLDGRPLPADLTAAERREVFVAALRARSAAAAHLVTPGQGPDWLPLQGSVELWCTQSNPGFGGCSGHHDEPAIDFGVPTGTPVHAAGPGVVTEASADGGGRGTYVDLLHPDGSSSHYYHLSALEVAPGQVVERGDRLGLSGSTGSTTAPHLHYEEHGLDGRPRPIGPILGQVGDERVSYPQGLFGLDWADVPYGTVLTNDGFRPVDGDLDGDGTVEWASGAVPASARPRGASATPGP